MKKILLGMAAVSALAVGAPAAAQQYLGNYQNNGYQNGYNVNGSLEARIGQLQTRIQTGVQSGTITRQEAVSLRQQLRQLRQVERQYSMNGLSGQERADLQLRLRNLRQQIRYAEGGRNGQYSQGGQYDRDYDDDDRYSDRMDRNRDGYDDRDYDRDGRWDDDYEGGYQQPAQRGGIGGIIDSVLGTGGLRVGQRVSGNLYAVPYEYRNQFRDSNYAYYRSDGRQIYQIDARTQTVVRVYPMNR